MCNESCSWPARIDSDYLKTRYHPLEPYSLPDLQLYSLLPLFRTLLLLVGSLIPQGKNEAEGPTKRKLFQGPSWYFGEGMKNDGK